MTFTGLLGSWIATVAATDCTTGAGTANQTISRSLLTYWSGTATDMTGLLTVSTPGPLTAADAVSLRTSHTAYSATALILGSGTLSWRPTLSVSIPTSAVAGMYSCVLTHSVA